MLLGSFLPIGAHVVLPSTLVRLGTGITAEDLPPGVEKVWLLLETIPCAGGEHTQKLTDEGLVRGSQPSPFDQM